LTVVQPYLERWFNEFNRSPQSVIHVNRRIEAGGLGEITNTQPVSGAARRREHTVLTGKWI